ncbi:hypothetical protein GCM10010440_49650 [Kitasatospora cinereorecta]
MADVDEKERGERLAEQEAALDALLADLGVTYDAEPDERVARLAARAPGYERYHRIGHKRQLALRTLDGDRATTARHADAVLRALLADDDPSSPNWLTGVLVPAIGRRQVQRALVAAVEHGTPYAQGCAVGVWHWAQAPLRYASEEARRAGRPTASSRAEREALADVAADFAAACRRALADCPDPWVRERLAAQA